MDILILGNGFDLAHDLKTKYKDFLDCCKQGKFREYCRTNLWMKHFLSKNKELGETWIDLEKEIYKVLEYLKSRAFMTGAGDSSRTCPQRIQVDSFNDNFSFYNLSNYMRKILAPPKKYPKDYNVEINSHLIVYLSSPQGFINFLYDQLREFTEAFEKYLEEDVLSKIGKESKYYLALQPSDVVPSSKNLYVLSFNYTDTCERLYKNKLNTYIGLNIQSFYIHGKANNSNGNNMVLGTHSFDNKAIPIDFNVFKKHNQRHKFGTISDYQKLLKIIKNPRRPTDFPVFHIVGHSLDITDHTVIRHILQLKKENSTIKIYYHDEAAQEKLTNRITDIIGEEEVMSKVQLIYQHDTKRGILRPKQPT